MADAERRLPCHCLLVDVPGEVDMAKIIAERIAAMPEDIRADVAQRRERLEECKACSSLRDGTCALCGCYVELRTAKRNQHCPAMPPKW